MSLAFEDIDFTTLSPNEHIQVLPQQVVSPSTSSWKLWTLASITLSLGVLAIIQQKRINRLKKSINDTEA